MIHIYKKGLKNNTLILLHGTGGDENSMLAIANHLDEQMNVLSIRGNVEENGMNRFFKRVSPGVFDLVNLEEETNRLYEFIKYASKQYGFDISESIIVGYSNGANIAINMLFNNPSLVKSAILLHPMIPKSYKDDINFNKKNIFIGAGKNDSMVTFEETTKLIEMFKSRHARVSEYFHYDGHRLTSGEIKEAKIFLDVINQ